MSLSRCARSWIARLSRCWSCWAWSREACSNSRRSTGENIDIYAGEVLLGWGEVLMMDGAMAVRLADLRNAGVPSLQADDASETQREVTNDERKH